ncbi:hypothetical protein ATERTT37_000005 [Aspergillus terreus]
MDEPIAIVGTGCRFPGASTSPSKLWQLLCEPRDLLQEVPNDRFQIDAVYHPDADHHGTTNVRCGYFLEEDIQHFDAALFSVSPAEANAMDPQQRLLLETVYEALEQGGFRLDTLRGSATGVFCGYLHNDYGQLQSSDVDAYPPYALVGNSPSMMANRVSYYFDWTGPSLSLNTGCSSSLLAVHVAVESLRRGECSTAVVAASNLLLTPDIFITAAKTGMLSPSGQCRMWDAHADGYGRGEGVAAVVLKRLRDAVADGDQIASLIRATGTNTDGRTMGILMPNGEAQQRLIERTYASIGLNPRSACDRCQYFEAHGTGTQAGDPQEATAIHNAFFGAHDDADCLYVGSIKSIIGHTEATAGLAGLIKASLSVQHGTIVPNRLLQEINPKIAPLASRLRVPGSCIPWPDRPAGTPRRASVNSFGFGGTNVHVIIDSYDPPCSGPGRGEPSLGATCRLPFVLSAASDRALGAVLEGFAQFVRQNSQVDCEDLADVLMTRRSALSHRLVLAARGRDELLQEVDRIAPVLAASSTSTPVTRARDLMRAPRILGVFTGQGVQWAQMGLDLLESCPAAQAWMAEFQDSLDGLPQQYRPQFRLLDELSAPASSSRLREPLIAQSLSTAVQIVQTNILRSLGLQFDLVVGHSSGEIAAAYAAGMLSARDAIRVAYLRGFATQNGSTGSSGAMMAVDVTWAEAEEICHQPPYCGKVSVGAYNAPSSVTLSGDVDVLRELHWILQSLGKSPVMLPVDTAYHSAHMVPCAELYQQALGACSILIDQPSKARWVSSVYPDQEVQREDGVDCTYWTENMLRPVRFAQAIRTVMTHASGLDAVIEVGAHATLRNPVLRTISSQRSAARVPAYISMGRRQTSSIQTLVHAIGSLWSHLGPGALTLVPYRALFHAHPLPPCHSYLRDLPVYPFDHQERYWIETRWSRDRSHGVGRPNALLGFPCVKAGGTDRLWRTYLRCEELPWLSKGPISSTLYVSMAVEAAFQMASRRSLRLIRVSNLHVHRQIPPPNPGPGTELLYQLSTMQELDDSGDEITATFACLVPVTNHGLRRIASGNLTITLGEPESSLLPPQMEPKLDSRVKPANLAKLSIANKPGNGIHLHPVTLDAALHLLLQGMPGGGCEAPLIIQSFEHIVVNPYGFRGSDITADAVVERQGDSEIWGAVDLFDVAGHGFVQLEGVRISLPVTPIAPASIFHKIIWQPLLPDARSGPPLCSPFLEESVLRCERLALMYLRQAKEQLTKEKRQALSARQGALVAWIDQLFGHNTVNPEWLADTVTALRARFHEGCWDDELVRTDQAGQLLSQFLSLSLTPILSSEDSLSQAYFPSSRHPRYERVERLITQFRHRYPHLELLEICAAGAPASPSLCSDRGHSLASPSHRCLSVSVPVEDMGVGLSSRGIQDGIYDVVVVNEALDYAADMAPALHAIRQRLRTGGYLVILAATETERLHLAFRPGVHIHRRTEWAAQLATTGFGGVDAANPPHEVALSGYSVMVAQALDADLRLLRDPFAATVLPWDRALVILSPEPTSPALVPQLAPFFREIREVFLRPDPDLSVLNASSVILVIQGPTPWTTKQQVLIEECLALSDAPVLWLSEDGSYYDQCGIHDLLATNLARIRLLHVPDARATEPKFLARLLLQWIHSQGEQPGWSALTGTAENDLRLRGGVLEVPRQVPCTTLDGRLHPHHDAVPTEQVQVEYRTSSDNSIHFTLVVSPGVVGDAMNPGHIRLLVKFSTIGAIPVAEECCLHLVLGRNQQSQSRMLTLAGTHRGTVFSPQDWCCEVPRGVCTEQEPTYLADVAAGLSALYLMQRCPPGSVLLVHEACPVERAVIASLASQQTTTVFYSTSRLGKDDDQPQRLVIHAYSSHRRLRQQLLPHRITALGCLNSAHAPLLSRIRDALSQEQKRPVIIAAHPFTSTYRTALVQRQRSRGIAASILHHNTALLSQSSTTRLNSREVYEALAQAIFGARMGNWQISAIVGQPSQGSVSLDDFARHPKMWHFAPDPVASLTPKATDTPLSEDQRIQRALEQTDNAEEAIGLMAQAITRRLRDQLQLPPEAVPPDDTPLGDLGWDSMMAVQLRVWMGRQLAVDLPVVRMMGGSCIRDVAREAAENFMAKRVGG